jgi:hypothetical protein
MFVGHYGVSFAAKRVAPMIPLWALFIAVQLLDVFWAPFVLLGIEKVRIVLTPTVLWRRFYGQLELCWFPDCSLRGAALERLRS